MGREGFEPSTLGSREAALNIGGGRLSGRNRASNPLERTQISAGLGSATVAPYSVSHCSIQFFRSLHSASFAVFLLVVRAHAVAYLPKLRRFALSDWAAARRAPGYQLRRGLVASAVVTAVAVGIAALQTAGPWVAGIRHGFGG